ncbi:MAG: LysE family translocator [Cognatishimia sp.]|uniref:LysE family translocator n=1 Tax=Cognatishimia sp. TaxID=2211648 RepID=UPI003B8D0BDF
MTFEILTALAAFAFVTSITPGPNNMMLLASGANFGFARSIPHMLGIGIGFVIMVILVGAGLMQLFDAWPPSYLILKILSAAYMLWLAWKIAHSTSPEGQNTGANPISFVQAALFQWVNPKAWTMALSSITLYAPGRELSAVLWVAIVFGAINLPCVSSWTILGQKLRYLLSNPTRLTVFNWTMAALLVISLVPSLMA